MKNMPESYGRENFTSKAEQGLQSRGPKVARRIASTVALTRRKTEANLMTSGEGDLCIPKSFNPKKRSATANKKSEIVDARSKTGSNRRGMTASCRLI